MTEFTISDPEGYDITTLLDTSTDEYIICGDLFDSTSTKKGIPSDAIHSNLKSNNLKNIRTILNNNIKLIFGNRDLNKLKCRYLNELGDSNELVVKFNNGNIDLSINSYQDLKKILSKEPWKIDSMNEWYTFWAKDVGSKKDWTSKTDYTNQPFFARFIEIFGGDNVKGTMSADNLLYTIPYEIGIYSTDEDYNAFIVLAIFKSMLLSEYIKTDESIKGMTNSSAVKGWLYNLFTSSKNKSCSISKNANKVFLYSHGGITKSLLDLYLDPSSPGKIQKIPYSLVPNTPVTDKIYEYLVNAYKYYESQTVEPTVKIITTAKQIEPSIIDPESVYIGVDELKKSKDVINKTYTEYMKVLEEKYDVNLDLPLEINKKYQHIEELVGGFFNKVENEPIYDYKILEQLCEYVNSCFTTHIKAIFDSTTFMEKPNSSMLFMLLMTAPFSCTNFVTKLNNKSLCDNILDVRTLSPILPGIDNMRKNYMFIKDGNTQLDLYQVIGHVPLGYAAIVDNFTNTVNSNIYNTYLINMDVSNSFHSDDMNKLKDGNLVSKTILVNNNGKLSIDSVINLDLEKQPAVLYTSEYINDTSALVGNNLKYDKKLVVSKELFDNLKDKKEYKFEFKTDLSSLVGLDKTGTFASPSEFSINYHGTTIIDGKMYFIFTHLSGKISFKKTLLALNETDFNLFTSVEKSYRNKYLKYKNKYLELRSNYMRAVL